MNSAYGAPKASPIGWRPSTMRPSRFTRGSGALDGPASNCTTDWRVLSGSSASSFMTDLSW